MFEAVLKQTKASKIGEQWFYCHHFLSISVVEICNPTKSYHELIACNYEAVYLLGIQIESFPTDQNFLSTGLHLQFVVPSFPSAFSFLVNVNFRWTICG